MVATFAILSLLSRAINYALILNNIIRDTLVRGVRLAYSIPPIFLLVLI